MVQVRTQKFSVVGGVDPEAIGPYNLRPILKISALIQVISKLSQNV